jgi:8-oxo-dGTP pyrophosphatase MutT (NUDIX family)
MEWHEAEAWGGIIINDSGQVLMRHPTGSYGGYEWTFAKGGADPEDASPEAAALREVREETGYRCSIVAEIPGVFTSDTTTTRYFLMHPDRQQGPPDHETTAIRWATPDEARALIAQTRTPRGRERDSAALLAAVTVWRALAAASNGIPCTTD